MASGAGRAAHAGERRGPRGARERAAREGSPRQVGHMRADEGLTAREEVRGVPGNLAGSEKDPTDTSIDAAARSAAGSDTAITCRQARITEDLA